jgi:hypothetical protein
MSPPERHRPPERLHPPEQSTPPSSPSPPFTTTSSDLTLQQRWYIRFSHDVDGRIHHGFGTLFRSLDTISLFGSDGSILGIGSFDPQTVWLVGSIHQILGFRVLIGLVVHRHGVVVCCASSPVRVCETIDPRSGLTQRYRYRRHRGVSWPTTIASLSLSLISTLIPEISVVSSSSHPLRRSDQSRLPPLRLRSGEQLLVVMGDPLPRFLYSSLQDG